MTKEVRSGGTFEDRTDSFMDWARANSRKLAIGGIVAVAAVLLVWGWRYSAAQKELSASRRLTEARQAVIVGNLPLAQSDLRQVIQRFDGTHAALQARLLLAQVLFDQQKVDEGVAVLREVRSPGMFAESYYALLAAGLEQGGKPAEAAAEYLRAAEAAIAEIDQATYRNEAARAFQKAGNVEEARRVWSEMAADDSSPLQGEAKVRLGELTAKPLGTTG